MLFVAVDVVGAEVGTSMTSSDVIVVVSPGAAVGVGTTTVGVEDDGDDCWTIVVDDVDDNVAVFESIVGVGEVLLGDEAVAGVVADTVV